MTTKTDGDAAHPVLSTVARAKVAEIAVKQHVSEKEVLQRGQSLFEWVLSHMGFSPSKTGGSKTAL
ncbi:MAG: hypothetical protein RL701_5499 [Pseudomonadota bacterium]